LRRFRVFGIALAMPGPVQFPTGTNQLDETSPQSLDPSRLRRETWVVTFEDARQRLNGLTGLYIGDDTESGGRIFMGLGQAGCKVRLSRRLVQGLQMLEALHPDLIFLDADFPDIRPGQLLRRVRQLPAAQSATIVVLGARDDRAVRRRLESAGADGFLDKPVDLRVCAQTLVRELPALSVRPQRAVAG
jgi:CheY-like chemotaxis protein